MELSISLLNAKDRKKTVKKLNNTKIDMFHIDVMDGEFVTNKSFPVEEIIELSSITSKPLDIHLMVNDPVIYIEKLNELSNINNITFHLEINKDINNILSKLKKYGIKRGIALRPNTDIKEIIPYLNNIDLLLVMTVEPGLGGQPFIETSTERIKQIKKIIKDYNIILEVDGGINDKTISKVSDANISVVGSFVTTSNNIEEAINKLIV